MKKIKEEKGSITLFVLIAMLFFIMFLTGMYMLSSNKESSDYSETAKIKEIYEKNVNQIDDVYETLVKEKEITIHDLKAGDYIKYDSGVNGIITCRVLYPASSEYGLQIISDKSVKNVTLGLKDNLEESKISYNNAIATLNSEAMGYLNTVYGIGARCIGSNPSDKNIEVVGPVTMQIVYNGSNEIDCKNTDNNYLKDYNAMAKANILTIGEYYWLASRYVALNPSNSNFDMRIVHIDGNLNSRNLCYVNTNGAYGLSNTFGFRPCIRLKSNIKIVKGDGLSEQTAYELGI